MEKKKDKRIPEWDGDDRPHFRGYTILFVPLSLNDM